jgi:hypothetical protein
MTTPLDLDAIQARADKATPGPWAVPGANVFRVIAIGPEPTGIVEYPEEHFYYGNDDLVYQRHQDPGADRAFIAAARTDVPALVNELRALRAEVARLRAVGEPWAWAIAKKGSDNPTMYFTDCLGLKALVAEDEELIGLYPHPDRREPTPTPEEKHE